MTKEMGKSVLILGGGLGGLFTGAILAKEGLEVTVLEKNATVGGGLQSFVRFGEVFDTGMHIIGGMREGGNIRRICEYLGIWDRVSVEDVDQDVIDTIFFSEDGRKYCIASGRHRYVEVLSEQFPDQRENLKAYVDAMYRIADEVDLFKLRPSTDYMPVHSDEFLMAADAFIAKYITDRRLRGVVAYMNPLYGGRGNMTPAYIHALISVLYIEGPSRFCGGSYRFAETLASFIKENGGKVIAGDGVTHIATEDRKVVSVSTAKGRTYSADLYVSDIHPCTLFTLMDDPSAFPKSYRNRLDALPNAYSAFTLSIKLKPESFRYFNHTAYYMTDYGSLWAFGNGEGVWPRGFLYMTPPEPRQGEFATKMIVTAPMLWDEVKKWENTYVGHRGAEYEQWKVECTGKLLDCMEKMMPGFRNCIEAINAASPLTIRDYYGVKEGSMCGFSKDCNNIMASQVPVVTKIPNLFLTGQNCNLHGFCGVVLTSINTSEAILGRNFILDKLDEFRDIRPYGDKEIPSAMRRIVSREEFPFVSRFVFPDRAVSEVSHMLESFTTVREFQLGVMHTAVDRIIKETSEGFVCEGVENLLQRQRFLFVSNHRDIMLDAALLQKVLTDNGLDTSEITFGANLMKGEFVIDVGKSNKMFRVERPGGSRREFYGSSRKLSEYIRSTILRKGQSVWIANRNGRTKDGVDRTDSSLIRMFAMSGTDDCARSLAELNILPISVSYEWEPCDVLKALELCARMSGPYEKRPGEDLYSILTGIRQRKGHIHMSLCTPISEDELRQCALDGKSSEFYRRVAGLLDRRICFAYKLFPNNYIAHDLLSGTDRYASYYTEAERDEFLSHMKELDVYEGRFDVTVLRRIFLGIYANPVDSARLFESK